MSMDCNNETPTMLKEKPDMSFGGLWNLSFGFFGVQIAYALQSANISRIFATLGATRTTLAISGYCRR